MRWFAATLFAAVLAATVPGAAWAETDVVLENESSGTDVQTGDSTFTNTNNESVSSGTTFEQRDEEAFQTAGDTSTGAAVQGQAEALAPATTTTSSAPATTQSLGSVPRSSADLVLADGDQQVSDSFDALFVGLPISDGSISS